MAHRSRWRDSVGWAAITAGAIAVVVAALLPFLTNLVTGTSPVWWMWLAYGLVVAATVGIAARQGARAKARAREELTAARERVLREFPRSPVGAHAGRPELAALLDPRQRTLPVVARGREIRELVEWCTGGAPVEERRGANANGRARVFKGSPAQTPARYPKRTGGDHSSGSGFDTEDPVETVRILEGVGGVGKTRLAIEVADRLPAKWYCGEPVAGRYADILERVIDVGDSTLIVVDDADTHPELPILLDAVLHHDQHQTTVRLLLLVRDAAIFQSWISRDSALLDRRWPRTTVPTVGDDSDRRRWFLAALRADLHASSPEGPETDPPRERVLPSPANLGPVGVDGEPMLVTCLRAALAAQDGATPAAIARARAAGTTQLADQLVGYERRRWRHSAPDPDLPGVSGISAAARAEAVLAMVVTNPATLNEAVAVLEHVQRLAGQPRDTLESLAEWVPRLYPGEQPHAGAGLVTPRPEFLAAALVAHALSTSPTDTTTPGTIPMAPPIASQLDWNQVAPSTASLHRLSRAAAWFPSVVSVIGDVLAHHPDAVTAAIEAAALAGPHAARALAPTLLDSLQVHEPSNNQIAAVLKLCEAGNGLGRVRVVLRRTGVDRARAIAASREDDNNAKAHLAEALIELSVDLAAVGQYREALEPAREAVDLCRGLAGAEPARYTAGLARSLNNLGNRLAALGQYREALEPAREAVDLWRGLAGAEPARYTGDLAGALNNLGVRLAGLGQYREALEPAREAVDLWRGLAGAEPARYTGGLAASLTSLGVWLAGLGQYREALEQTREAVDLWRGLARAEPARYTADLADSLHDLGVRLAGLGQYREALEQTREAVDLWRGLAGAEPARYTADLAASLNSLGIRLAALGQYREALEPTREAVDLYREVAGAEPARYTAGLAASLNNLGIGLAALGQYREALEPTREAVDLYRELAGAEPARYTADLADSLNNLGNRLAALGQYREALEPAREAVDLRRELAGAEPARYTGDLADSLTSLGIRLAALAEHHEAMRCRAEAVAWRARLARLSDEHTQAYRDARAALVRAYTIAGYPPEAAYRAERDAARQLPPDHPSAQVDEN